MNIMTYDGNKFDLRVWAAVTSLDPLRIYLLGTGIPKVPHAHAHAHARHMHMHVHVHTRMHTRVRMHVHKRLRTHMHMHAHPAHTHHYHRSAHERCRRCSPWQISQWKYSKAAEHVKEQCIHVLLPGTSECYVSGSPLVNILNPYPRSTSDAAWPTHTKPGGRRLWQRAWASIEAQLVELMLLTREARRPSW